MFCVPAHLQRLFAHWDAAGGPDLSGFRLVAHAGAPCPTALKRRLSTPSPTDRRGSSTARPRGSSPRAAARSGSSARAPSAGPDPGGALTVDDDGTIWCAVPAHARFTYWRRPGEDRRGVARDARRARFIVGDLGRLDDDGYLYLDGRRDDLVISGGVNVYPLEVEQALREHPGVDDVAVFGVPDERWGQRVCAAVVGAVDEAELASYARERLAPPKRPKSWTFTDELPRTTTGKVRRDRLADLRPAGGPAPVRRTDGGTPPG